MNKFQPIPPDRPTPEAAREWQQEKRRRIALAVIVVALAVQFWMLLRMTPDAFAAWACAASWGWDCDAR